MIWQPPLWLGGPILEWELRRATRLPWVLAIRCIFGVWLAVQAFFLVAILMGEMHRIDHSRVRQLDVMLMNAPTTQGEAAQRFAEGYLTTLAFQQLVILMLATPLITAGALGVEKEKGTLGLLLSTDLRASEIIIGKLLARLLILGQLGLLSAPALFLAGAWADAPLGRIILIELQAAAATVAFASITLLVSLLTRSTREAILGCYATLILVYVGLMMLLGGTLPAWIEPFTALERLSRKPYLDYLDLGYGQLGFWLGTALLCLVLTLWRLRPAALKQLEGAPRASRLLWSVRPRLRNDPIRWREQYILGIAPLPMLRLVPGWLAKLAVLTFAVILAMTGVTNMQHGLPSLILAGEFSRACQSLTRLDPARVFSEVAVMGGVLFVLSVIVVMVRAGTCISEERRRKTWDDIIMTPLTLEEIRTEKMWGILRATHVYLLLYALPMVALASLGETPSVVLALLLPAVTWIAMLVAAVFGTEFSISRANT
jgi:ABC-type transport system involved in multi-copper enzyme maturation permease subunit